ncbi:MAG TPA: 50S ribosomal protein L29 [Bacteroidota bacterium]|nr:50S ribosomal protein L29 [Bacteroidota bacterium]
MKMTEIRQLALDELRKRLVDEEENLSNLRFQLSTRQLESPIRVRTVRRDIARIKTMIHMKEQQNAVAAKSAAPAETTAAKKPETTETKAS